MTLPLLAGSALKRASCASPTVSKNRPTAQTAAPTIARGPIPSGAEGSCPACTGSETIHISRPWSRNTLKRLMIQKRPPGLLPHRHVAVVLALAQVAVGQVAAQAQPPHAHQGDEQPAAGLAAVGQVVGPGPGEDRPGHQHEAGPPEDVDDRGVPRSPGSPARAAPWPRRPPRRPGPGCRRRPLRTRVAPLFGRRGHLPGHAGEDVRVEGGHHKPVEAPE